jgi:hypothetical protein
MPLFSNGVHDFDKEVPSESLEADFAKNLPQYLDVFSEVSSFQAGCLKRQGAPGGDAKARKLLFIPFFPFLYENIANGNLIMDTKGKV